MKPIWIIGQVTADRIFRGKDSLDSLRVGRGGLKARVGGKAFNIAAAIARLGGRVELITALGKDSHGAAAFGSMYEAGVGSRFVVQSDGRTRPIPTPITKLTEGIHGERVVSVDIDKRLTQFYDISLDRALECLEDGGYPPAAIVYTLEQPDDTIEKLAKVVRAARDNAGAFIIGNPAPRRPGVPSPSIGELIRLSDVIIPNRYESAFLLGLNIVSSEPNGELPRRIRETYGIDSVVCTLGSSGWAWSSRDAPDGTANLPVVQVREKVGASDVFTGVYAALVMAGCTIETACFTAGAAARDAVRRQGGHERFPSRDRLVKVLRGLDGPNAGAAIKSLRELPPCAR